MKTGHYLIFLISSIITVGCNNLCKDNDCNDTGYCYDGACICDKWYSGEDCSLQFNRHYEGEYRAEVDAQALLTMDSLRILAHHSIPNRIYTLNGPYMDFVTDSTLIIPEQDFLIDSNWILIRGSGKFDPNHLQYSFGEVDSYDATADASIIYTFNCKNID
jgi:hypothetical protein